MARVLEGTLLHNRQSSPKSFTCLPRPLGWVMATAWVQRRGRRQRWRGQCDFPLTRLSPKVGTFLGNVLMDTDSLLWESQGWERAQEEAPWLTPERGDQVRRGQWYNQREICSEGFSQKLYEVLAMSPMSLETWKKSKEQECSWKCLLFFFSWAEKIFSLPVFLISQHPVHHMVMLRLQLPKGCETAQAVTQFRGCKTLPLLPTCLQGRFVLACSL